MTKLLLGCPFLCFPPAAPSDILSLPLPFKHLPSGLKRIFDTQKVRQPLINRNSTHCPHAAALCPADAAGW